MRKITVRLLSKDIVKLASVKVPIFTWFEGMPRVIDCVHVYDSDVYVLFKHSSKHKIVNLSRIKNTKLTDKIYNKVKEVR